MTTSYPSYQSKWLNRIEYCFSGLVIGVLAFQILVVVIFSFQFRPIDDSSFIYYLTWLINERGYLPYLDLHETSFPGTFLIYSLITRITGYSADGFNTAHTFLLLLLSIASYGFLRRIHPRMALIATLLFCSSYLLMNNSVYMQRDFVALLFVISACNTMTSRLPIPFAASLTGLLFGMAAAIKPQMALSAPVVVYYGAHIQTMQQEVFLPHIKLWKVFFIAAAISFCCFLLVALAFIGWLSAMGSWHAFTHMLTDYMPLYEMLNGVGEQLTLQERWQKGMDWLQGNLTGGAIPALAGIIAAQRNQTLTLQQKSLVYLVTICWGIYVISVSVGGKFYDYHQIPQLYFYSCVIALFFIPTTINFRSAFMWRTAYFAFAVLFIQSHINPGYAWAMTCNDDNPACMIPERTSYDTEDRLAQFLRENLKLGERVEPLTRSVVGSVFSALLKADAELVTPYPEGFPFYHHINSSYTNNIRADAMQRLEQNPPRFFIAASQGFFPIAGDTNSDFTALGEFIKSHYVKLDKSRYPMLHDPMPIAIYELQKK